MLDQIPQGLKGLWPQLYFLAPSQETSSFQIEREIRKYPRLLRRFLGLDLLPAHDFDSMLPVTPFEVAQLLTAAKDRLFGVLSAIFQQSFTSLSLLVNHLDASLWPVADIRSAPATQLECPRL